MKPTLLLILLLSLSLPVYAEDAPAQDEKKPKASPEETFKLKDKNGDGSLTLEEFIGKMEGERKTKSGENFAKKDANKDGKLEFEEFTTGPSSGNKKKSE